jgi:hypothetical protein
MANASRGPVSPWALAAALALALAAPAAHAQTPPPSDAARADFERALSLAEAGDCKQALPLFVRSYAASPANGPLFNMALCERDLGLVASAVRHFEELARKLPPGDDRLRETAKSLASLAPRVPHVRIRLAPGAPANASVTLDGEPVAAGALGTLLPLDPGDHAVRVAAPGRPARESSLRVAERDDRELVIEVGVLPPPAPPLPVTAPAPAAPAASPPPEAVGAPMPDRPAESGAAWPWVVGGLGLAAGGVAVALAADYAAAQSTIANDCPLTNAIGQLVCDQRRYSIDDAHALQQRRDRDLGLAIGLGAAGAAAIGTAIVGLVAGRRDSSRAGSVGVVVAPWGVRAGGLVVQGAM